MQISTKDLHFRQDIQGLRGVAVLLVVLFHAEFEWLSGGFVGVDVFFVISGFLITSLLLKEFERSGGLNLPNFYARRIRRLLPAALFVLTGVIITSWFLYSPLEIRVVAAAGVSTALYISNIWFATEWTDYLGTDTESNPLLHTWSLAVEEQFYLVWPLLILIAARILGRRDLAGRLIGITVAMCVISFMLSIYLTERAQPWAFFGSPTRAWQFGIGALLAIFAGKTLPGKGRAAHVLGAIGLSMIAAAALSLNKQTTYPGLAVLLPTVGSALVILAGLQGTQVLSRRLLSAGPLCFVGDISYSLYLWHWPVFVFMRSATDEFGLIHQLLGIALSTLLAWLTYLFIENPVRFNRFLKFRPATAIGLALTLSFLVAGLALGVRYGSIAGLDNHDQRKYLSASNDIPVIYENGCHLDVLETKIEECVYGEQTSDFDVVLFGDSHAAQWFPALESIALQQHWRLTTLTKSACPSVDVPIYRSAYKKEISECLEWRQNAIELIGQMRPDLVILSNSRRSAYRDTTVSETEQLGQWRSGFEKTLSQIVASGATTVVIRDTPRIPYAAPTCLSKAKWRDLDGALTCRFDAATDLEFKSFRSEMLIANTYDKAHVVDMEDALCPVEHCSVERDNLVLFRDADHITASFSILLAAPLFERMQSAFETESLQGRHISQIR